MNRLRRKCWQTDCQILCSVYSGRAVANPLSAAYDDSLAWIEEMRVIAGLYLKLTAKHNAEFVEFGCLPRFSPSRGANHPRDADGGRLRIDVPNELLDYLWQVAVGLDTRRLFDNLCHREEGLSFLN
jgi:hypothetical protein